MAASWLLQALYASLLGQSLTPDKPPSPGPVTFVVTKTPYGDIKGTRSLTATNVSIDSYLGIPFALPPVGLSRFSKPEPAVKWAGVKDATNFGNECYQRTFPGYQYKPVSIGPKPIDQSEDCLYLNVYVPADTKSDNPLAVMVWIHGGAFTIGAGSQYDGTELAATAGVIVVTINYRLDVFGFLSNEDVEMPGNFGMLDQVMALKWVKENIQSFGGDPNKVTIFGESAGSASVSLLVLSPLASGLFNRAIMESGVSLSQWAVARPSSRLSPSTIFALIASQLGCTDFDMTKKLQCLRNAHPVALMNASATVQNVFPLAALMSPRVEQTFSFLPEQPMNLWQKNKFNHVDTIRGFNTDEYGAYFAGNVDGLSKEEFVKTVTGSLQPYVITERDNFINKVLESYVGTRTNKTVIRNAGVRFLSDIYFTGPTLLEANMHSEMAKSNKHFVFEFQHKPSFSIYPPWLKAVHGEEIAFVFGPYLPMFVRLMSGKVPSKEDLVVWNQMKTMWSNFAKYGNPTQTIPPGAVNWTPYDSKQVQFLKIDTSSQMMPHKSIKAINITTEVLQHLQTGNFETVIG